MLADGARDVVRVYGERQLAIEKRFDEAMEDSTLFLELRRTYSSTLSFYLQFKAAKVQAVQSEKHGIFSVLRHRVNSLRKVHRQPLAFMARLPADWDHKQYQQRKKELLTYEQQRQREVEAKRAREKLLTPTTITTSPPQGGRHGGQRGA